METISTVWDGDIEAMPEELDELAHFIADMTDEEIIARAIGLHRVQGVF